METGIHELTAGYALDALDDAERRAYEAHLASCEQCQGELESFWLTTEALAVAATGPEPSDGLRGRILADARNEPQVVVPFMPRRRRLVPVLAATAAVAAVVALAIGLWAAHLSTQLDDSRSALDRERTNAAVLVDPDSRSVALETGTGKLVVDPEGRSVLVVDGLGPAPSGKTYELWIMPDKNADRAARAGLFQGRQGTQVVGVDGTVQTGDLVAVTLERAGGVDRPSATPIVTSQQL
jgi:anti-sigma-K factor RskA